MSYTDETRPSAHSAQYGPYGLGSVLCGKYRLDALIGEGAMGAVWQATNLPLDAPVAIKLTHSDLDGAFRERLQLEARAAAGFGHPAIVRVFDVAATERGDPFIVMELLQGNTLARLLRRGPFSAVRAIQIILPVVDALSTMHARGVVHRDLKPDNLLISLEDERVQPKILDFGIAKVSAPCAATSGIDESGTWIGSPEYMSPEQAVAHDDIDCATDVWSICVVIYEAVSGKTPFRASTAELVLRAITVEEPASLVESGVVDERLWRILRTGLAKDRNERQQSMSALGRELAAWLLANGVHEDVCGTSLEAKWFGDSEAVPGTGAQLGGPTQNDAILPARLFDERPPLYVRSAALSPARPWRGPRIVAACAFVGSLALAFSASKQARTPVRAETKVEQGASPRPAGSLEEVMVRPANDLVKTVAVNTADTAMTPVAPQKPSGRAATSSSKHKEGVPLSVAATKAAAKANGTDLGLLAPY